MADVALCSLRHPHVTHGFTTVSGDRVVGDWQCPGVAWPEPPPPPEPLMMSELIDRLNALLHMRGDMPVYAIEEASEYHGLRRRGGRRRDRAPRQTARRAALARADKEEEMAVREPGLRGRQLAIETVRQVLWEPAMWNQSDVFRPASLIRNGLAFQPRPDAPSPSLCGSVGCLVGWVDAQAYVGMLRINGLDDWDEDVEARFRILARAGKFDEFFKRLLTDDGYAFIYGSVARLRRAAVDDTEHLVLEKAVFLAAYALELPVDLWCDLETYVYDETTCPRHALLNFMALTDIRPADVGIDRKMPPCTGCHDSRRRRSSELRRRRRRYAVPAAA